MRRKAALVVLGLLLGSCGFSKEQFHGDAGPDEPVTIGFAQTTSLQDESSGAVQVIVRLSRPAPEPVSVTYTFSGGSAVFGEDYTTAGQTGTLDFAANVAEMPIDLAITVDAMEEQDETIELTLSNPTGNSRLGEDQHTITISAALLPRVNFMTEMSDADEANNLTLTLQLDTPPLLESTVSIAYKMTSTAAVGFDFSLPTSTTVTFPANTTTQTIMIPIMNDDVDEDDERVDIEISTTTNVVIGTKKLHEHTIHDNDNPPTVQFTTASSSANEGNSGMTNVVLTVQLSGPSGKAITVPVTYAGGTASENSDYTYLAKTDLTFAPNQNPAMSETMKTITLRINGDTTDEDAQTVITTLGSTPTNATLGTNTAYTYTINNDDMAPTVQFMTNNQMVNEGDSGTTTTTYTLTLSQASEKQITFEIQLGGTATIPADYTTVPVSNMMNIVQINLSMGTTATIDLVVVGETTVEGADETITMALIPGTMVNVRAASGNQSRTHTIKDMDPN